MLLRESERERGSGLRVQGSEVDLMSVNSGLVLGLFRLLRNAVPPLG